MSKKSSRGIGWVIEQFEKGREYPNHYEKQNKNFINQKTLFACPKCRCAWEYLRREGRTEIYDDFPTIGLEKEVCIRCKNKSQN